MNKTSIFRQITSILMILILNFNVVAAGFSFAPLGQEIFEKILQENDVLQYLVSDNVEDNIGVEAENQDLEDAQDDDNDLVLSSIVENYNDEGSQVGLTCNGIAAEFTLTVNAVNDAPTIAEIPDAEILQTYTFEYQVQANDVDEGDVLSYAISYATYENVEISEEGLMTWTPTIAMFEPNEITVTVTDDGEPQLSAEFAFTVTPLPVLYIGNTYVHIGNEIYNVTGGEEVSVMPGQTVQIETELGNAYTGEEESSIGITDFNAHAADFNYQETKQFPGPDDRWFIYPGELYQVNFSVDIPLDVGVDEETLTYSFDGLVHELGEISAQNSIGFTVDRENRDVRLINKTFLPTNNLTCDKNTHLELTFFNAGNNQVDVVVHVESDSLGLRFSDRFTLDSDGGEYTSIFEDFNGENISGSEYFTIIYYYPDDPNDYHDGITLYNNGCFYDPEIVQNEGELLEGVVDLREHVASDDPSGYTFEITGQEFTTCVINNIENEDVGYELACGAPVDEDVYGESQVNITINTGAGLIAESFIVTVLPVPDAPVISDVEPAELNEGETLTIALSGSDADDDEIVFSANLTRDGAAVTNHNNGTATFTWTPTQDSVGENVIEFIVEDSTGRTASTITIITVHDVNYAPEITVISPAYESVFVLTENQSQMFSVSVTDHDQNQLTVVWNLDGEAVDGLINGNTASYIYMAENEAGTNEHTVSVSVSDGTAETVSAWTFYTSDVPFSASDQYDGTMLQLDINNVANATGVYIQSGNSKIDFGNLVLDLRNVADVDNNMILGNGIVGINTDNLPALNRPATVTFYGVAYNPDMHRLYYSEGFGQENGVACTTCSNIEYTEITGELSFSVTGFSTVWLADISDQTTVTITSGPITSVFVNDTYQYDVEATTTADNTAITFRLTTSPEGMSINADTGLITWEPSTVGTYAATVVATDVQGSTATQSFSIEVSRQSMLRISDLDVKVGSKKDSGLSDGDSISKDAEPGSEVSFQFEIENAYTDDDDIEIEDITVTVTIEGIDDGDDLEEESDEFDLKPEKDKNVDLDFTLPLRVESGTYNVLIHVEGEDTENQNYEIEWNLELTVDKESHKVIIENARLNDAELSCYRSTALSVDVLNIGDNEEERARLTISNDDLNLNVVQNFELSDDVFDEDAEYSYSTMISLDEDFPAGVYPIEIHAYYSSTHLSDTRTIDLIVRDCGELEVEEEDTGELVVIEREEGEAQVPSAVAAPVYATTEVDFRESSTYMILLLCLNIIVLGLLIFGIGALLIRFRKY